MNTRIEIVQEYVWEDTCRFQWITNCLTVNTFFDKNLLLCIHTSAYISSLKKYIIIINISVICQWEWWHIHIQEYVMLLNVFSELLTSGLFHYRYNVIIENQCCNSILLDWVACMMLQIIYIKCSEYKSFIYKVQNFKFAIRENKIEKYYHSFYTKISRGISTEKSSTLNQSFKVALKQIYKYRL